MKEQYYMKHKIANIKLILEIMDIETRYMKIVEQLSLNHDEYERTNAEIADKLQQVSSLSASITEVELNNGTKISELSNFGETTSKQLISEVKEIKGKMNDMYEAVLKVCEKLGNDEVERVRSEYSAKTKEINENLQKFEKKKM